MYTSQTIAGINRQMTIYMFGKRVTQNEKMFLEKYFDGKSRLEQGKQFKTIYNIASRHDTSMQMAAKILENNKKYTELLNQNNSNSTNYFTDKFGYIRQNNDNQSVRIQKISYPKNDIENSKKNFFKIFLSKIKTGLLYISSLFEVY